MSHIVPKFFKTIKNIGKGNITVNHYYGNLRILIGYYIEGVDRKKRKT